MDYADRLQATYQTRMALHKTRVLHVADEATYSLTVLRTHMLGQHRMLSQLCLYGPGTRLGAGREARPGGHTAPQK